MGGLEEKEDLYVKELGQQEQSIPETNILSGAVVYTAVIQHHDPRPRKDTNLVQEDPQVPYHLGAKKIP